MTSLRLDSSIIYSAFSLWVRVARNNGMLIIGLRPFGWSRVAVMCRTLIIRICTLRGCSQAGANDGLQGFRGLPVKGVICNFVCLKVAHYA
jgi:hypothetical protein